MMPKFITRFLESFKPPLDDEQKGQLSHFGESVEILSHEGGDSWLVTPLKFGKSKREPFFVYTKEAVTASLPAFDGAPVYINAQADDSGHKQKPNEKVVKDMIGYLSKPNPTDDRLTATLTILPSAKWFKDNLLFLASKNKLDFYQLSIDAYGTAETKEYNGEQLPHAKTFVQVDVDVVQRGAAGGEFNHLLESLKHPNDKPNSGVSMNALKQRLMALFTILYPSFLESKQVDWLKVNENELFTHLLEANKPQDRLHLPDGFKIDADNAVKVLDDVIKKITEAKPTPANPLPPAPAQPAQADNTDFKESMKKMQESLDAVQKQNCQHMLEAELATSNLPDPLKGNIRKTFTGKLFTEAEMKDHIKDVKDTYAKLFAGTPQKIFIEAGQDAFDKVRLGLMGLFMESAQFPLTKEERKDLLQNVEPMRSFKEGYVLLTGDKSLSGRKPYDGRFREAIGTGDWDQVAADVMHKALVRIYGMMNLDTWRPFVKIVPLNDFRNVHRHRIGGYGTLPTVAQRGAYGALTSPTDEEAYYAPTKKGGTEEITLEMIRNDDVGAIRDIPQKLARAAAWTLHKFIYDKLKPAGAYTIYDSGYLYQASHPIATGVTQGNTGTTAIATGLALARTAMMKFVEKDANLQIGIRSRFALVPPDLEDTAYGLVTVAYGMYNQTPTNLQRQGIQVIVVPYWSDATDYAVVADPADVLGFELGFLDGKQEPELFVSDIPNTGSFFTNDAVTFKIRHIYGGDIIDWRAFYGQTVAG